MNLSSGMASSVTSAFLSEPPLSPEPGPTPAAAPMPQLRTVEAVPTPEPTPTAPAGTPSLESQLLRMRLVTPDQIASAMREEAETGRALAEIVVANGWVSADDLARLQTPAASVPVPTAAPAPAPVPTPAEPGTAPAPAPAPQPEPAAAPVAAAPPPPAPAAPAVPAPVAEAPAAEAPAPEASPAENPAPASLATTLGTRVLVRLENGERIDVGDFAGAEAAKERARTLMAELRQAAEWPFLGGRYVRPEAIVSIDIELTGL
jgi:hypothetical protein